MGELKAEISKLHKKLFEQEKKLHNTLKLLQLSKNQEKVIFDQCEWRWGGCHVWALPLGGLNLALGCPDASCIWVSLHPSTGVLQEPLDGTAPAGPWAGGPSTSLTYKGPCGPDPGRSINDHRVPRVLGPRG